MNAACGMHLAAATRAVHGMGVTAGQLLAKFLRRSGEADLGTHPQPLRQSVRPRVRCIAQRRLRAFMPASVPARARQQAGPGRMASPWCGRPAG